jgi:hypothetical protein
VRLAHRREAAVGATAQDARSGAGAGGWFIAAIPASPAPCPDRTGLYVEIVGEMNLLLADWRRAGRISGATVAAAVVPVWSRTLGEFRAPFEAGGGHFAEQSTSWCSWNIHVVSVDRSEPERRNPVRQYH